MNALTVDVPTEPLEKSEGSATLASTEPSPPLHLGQCVHKATILPNASELSQEKNASKSISVWEARLEKEAKEVVQQKNIKVALTAYKKWVKEMGFESTPIPTPPPPPPGATSGAKKISAIMTNLRSCDGEMLDVTDYSMDFDDEYGVMSFITEVAEVDDPDPEEDTSRCKFPGFHKLAHTGMRIEEQSEDKDKDEGDEDKGSPLYKMDELTSEADVLMSSTFKPSHYSEQSKEDSIEEDIEQTPIARKVKKGKVKGKGEMKDVRGKETLEKRTKLT